jgi:arabinose-5-phosphate isomerase
MECANLATTDPTIRQSARSVFQIEASAILALADRLDATFDQVVEEITQTQGRVIVCGIGKSGIIARKISATLSSTGTPSFFMHPAEAFHGDLGMIQVEDIFLLISYSGETDEVLKLLPFLRDNKNRMIALTAGKRSRLASAVHHVLDISVEKEACPLQLAPTASTTATLAMGDAIAIAVMEKRGFQPESFAKFHPGGSLGRRLLLKVRDEMAFENLPFVSGDATAMEVIHAITRGRLGLAIVQSDQEIGLITDGDLRRAMERLAGDVFQVNARSIMTRNPKTVSPTASAHDAVQRMHEAKITSLLVLENDKIVGVFQK